MPVTISGDGGIAGISSLGGGDFVAGSLTSSGDLIAGPQAVDRATLFVDDSDNSVSINTTVTPAAGVFLQVADATDPIVSLNNTGNGEVRLGCTAAGGYIGTESNHPFDIQSNSLTAIKVAANGNVAIGDTTADSALHIYNDVAQIKLEDADGGAGRHGLITVGATGNLFLSADVTNAGNNTIIAFEMDGGEVARMNGLRSPYLKLGANSSTTVGNAGIALDLETPNGINGPTIVGRNINTDDDVTQLRIAALDNTGNLNSSNICADIFLKKVTDNPHTGLIRFRTNRGNTVENAFDITPQGNIAFPNGQGIDFSAATGGVGTVDNSLLDDYEEGTWTPTFGVESGSFNINQTSQTGDYRKIGSLVIASFSIVWNSFSNINGNIMTINGLPYGAPAAGDIKGYIGDLSGMRYRSWGGITGGTMLGLLGYSNSRITTFAGLDDNNITDTRGRINMLNASGKISGCVIYTVN